MKIDIALEAQKIMTAEQWAYIIVRQQRERELLAQHQSDEREKFYRANKTVMDAQYPGAHEVHDG